jgi:cytoskeletal protein CcmA (bactofilin family)
MIQLIYKTEDMPYCVIGYGSSFDGNFEIDGNLRIEGKFIGDLKISGIVYITETGKVKTTIKAKEIIIAGTMIGDIIAEKKVIMEETGRMVGQITSPEIECASGFVFDGTITITGNQPKDSRQVVLDSFE